MEYFLDDTDLLHVFFAGVGVVCIDDIPDSSDHARCRGLRAASGLRAVVRQALVMLVDSTTQDGVGQRLPCVFTSQLR